MITYYLVGPMFGKNRRAVFDYASNTTASHRPNSTPTTSGLFPTPIAPFVPDERGVPDPP